MAKAPATIRERGNGWQVIIRLGGIRDIESVAVFVSPIRRAASASTTLSRLRRHLANHPGEPVAANGYPLLLIR